MTRIIPTLTTARLSLRPFSDQDAEALYSILRGEDVLKYFPWPGPPPLERVQRFITRQLAHWGEHGFGWWAVELSAQPGLLGWNGLQYLPETGEIEVGYLVSKSFWGQGIATEGAQASLKFGFETLNLENIIALVHPENKASIRVIEKLGMAFDFQAEYFGMQVRHYSLSRACFAP